jgi:hypothetical protein
MALSDKHDTEPSRVEDGSGPLVLCLHGVADTPWTFPHQLRAVVYRNPTTPR